MRGFMGMGNGWGIDPRLTGCRSLCAPALPPCPSGMVPVAPGVQMDMTWAPPMANGFPAPYEQAPQPPVYQQPASQPPVQSSPVQASPTPVSAPTTIRPPRAPVPGTAIVAPAPKRMASAPVPQQPQRKMKPVYGPGSTGNIAKNISAGYPAPTFKGLGSSAFHPAELARSGFLTGGLPLVGERF